MNTRRIIIIIVLISALLLTLTACDLFEEEESTATQPALVVDRSVVSATGMFVPGTYAYLSAPSAGIVGEVLVGEGETVEEGQELLTLGDLAPAKAALAAAELELEAAQQALDDLNETADLARANAWLALLNAQEAFDAAQEAWDDLDVDDLEDDIDDAREDVTEAEDDLEDAQDKYDTYADLDEDSALRKKYEDELIEAQEEYNEKVRALNEILIELERAEAALAAAQAALAQAEADYEATFDGPDPDQLALAEARLANAEAQVEAAQTQIDNLTLTAPFVGTVVEININPGEWASPGVPILVLADLESLRVETTDLNEIDVVQFSVGDMALVTFDALPGEVFEGTVTEISQKASEGSGVNYTVIIELDDIPEDTRWGMTVFVDIDIDQ